MKQITTAQMDTIEYGDFLKLRELKALRNEIAEALSLKQFEQCMFMTHVQFANKAMKVSRSKKIAVKAQMIIALYNSIANKAVQS